MSIRFAGTAQVENMTTFNHRVQLQSFWKRAEKTVDRFTRQSRRQGPQQGPILYPVECVSGDMIERLRAAWTAAERS